MKQSCANATWLHTYIDTVPDFPKPGVIFQIFSRLLASPKAMQRTLDLWTEHYATVGHPDVIAAIDSRGFILGSLIAYRLSLPFAMIRKEGKLPNAIVSQKQTMEYASTVLELEKGTIQSGQRVLIVDDVMATGGTGLAACELIEKVGAEVFEVTCLIEIFPLEGRKKLKDYALFTLTGEKPHI